jgi:hypothetical protein
MLNLGISFQLIARRPGALPHSSLHERRRSTAAEVILEGLSISIKVGTKTYEVSSDRPPEHDSAGPFRGTTWTRWLWPLIDGMSIEQQMMTPMGGDALAVSWRVNGPTFFPCRLGVRPIFRAPQPFRDACFEFEPETNGGRLAWQPLKHSSRVIADLNGRFSPVTSPVGSGIVPGSFEFDLSTHPAVLIFSAEFPRQAKADPLIGGFLAQLSAERAPTAERNHFRHLVAA